MRPSEAVRTHRSSILAVAIANRVRNVRLFGSALRGEDTEDSDLDLLVDPTPETSLMDIARIQNRLHALLGIRVDVLTPKALPPSFRDKVLAEAKPL